MGWKLHRVWSTEWFQNREASIKLMLDSVERALFVDSVKSMPAASLIEDKEYSFKTLPAPNIIKRYKSGIPYSKYKKRFNREILILPQNLDRLMVVLLELIELEGPIHEDFLNERLKEVFKVQKIGANIRANVKKAVELALRNKSLECIKPFIWGRYSELKKFRISGDDVKRPIHYISSQEIEMAILYLVEDQFGIMRDEVPHAVTKVFDTARTNPEEIDRIHEITAKLIEEKQLIPNGIRVNLP